MSKYKCPKCSGDIILEYLTPTKVFSIDDNDQLKRIDDNVICQPDGDSPYLVFRCENDSEHDIETKEIGEWSDEINNDFYNKKLFL